MSEQEILDEFSRILGDVIMNDSLRLTMETRREEVAGWDSLAYITFIVGVEQEFGVKFGIAEVESFENVGAIVRLTQERLARR